MPRAARGASFLTRNSQQWLERSAGLLRFLGVRGGRGWGPAKVVRCPTEETPILHPDIENLSRVSYLPGLLATVTALLALATIIHTLASSVGRRRRDMAVSRPSASCPAGVRRAGLAGQHVRNRGRTRRHSPGVATGRWPWQLVAVKLDVPDEPIVPILEVLAVAGGTFAAASLVAVGPGLVAGRIRPAAVLRAE